MSFSPRNLGDPRAFHCTFKTDSGVYPLTGIDTSLFKMFFVRINSQKRTQGTGTWTITDGASGLADYTPASTDVIQTTPSVYRFYPVIDDLPFDAQEMTVVDPGFPDIE